MAESQIIFCPWEIITHGRGLFFGDKDFVLAGSFRADFKFLKNLYKLAQLFFISELNCFGG